MKFLPINEQNIHQIAVLHKKAFPKYHFTSRFSIKLLENYFRYLIKYLEFSHMILGENNELYGYMIGGSKSSQAISAFNRDYGFQILIILLKNPSFIWEKILSILYGLFGKEAKESKTFSGYIICVDPDIKVHVGLALIKHFEKKLTENNINEYYVSVRSNNYKVIEMYQSMNFTKVKERRTTVVFKKTLL
jgi:ribosomal protein S18 acetylase RimI-like enzyme